MARTGTRALRPGVHRGDDSRLLCATARPTRALVRVVVITDDVLTPKMAGPAIRAWHIAEALAAEHDVVLATTSELCDVTSPHFSVESADRARFAELERWCDVAIVQGYLLHNVPGLRGSQKVMVFDLYDPLHLEALVLTRDDPEPERSVNVANTVRTLEEQLVRGDFFVCASDKQRDLWLGFLAALGRVNPRTYERRPDPAPSHRRGALRSARRSARAHARRPCAGSSRASGPTTTS